MYPNYHHKTQSIPLIFRRLLIAIAVPAALAAAVLVIPLWLDAGSPENASKYPFYRVRTARAINALASLDTIADYVYGQPDFTSTTANNGGVSNASLSAPGSMVIWAETGQIFIADTANNRILGWDSVDDYISAGPSASLVLGQPDFTSTTANNGGVSAAGLNQPAAITLDFFGALYVSDTGNNRVLVYEPTVEDDGFLTFTNGQAAAAVIGQPNFTSNGLYDPPTRGSLNQPMGLVIDYYGNLVVADRDNNRVLIFEEPVETGMEASWVIGQPQDAEARYGDLTTKAAPNPPSATSLNAPTGVAVGAVADELYIADTGNHRILIYNDEHPYNGQADYVIGQPGFTSNTPNNGGVSATSVYSPTGLKIDSADRLFVADTGNNRVLVYTNPLASQSANSVIGQPDFTSNTPNNGGVSATSLNAPTGIDTDEVFLDVYIADQGNNRVLGYEQPLPNAVPKITELYPGTVRASSAGFTLEIWGAGIISDTTVQVNGAPRQTDNSYLGLVMVDISAAEVAAPGSIVVSLTNPSPGGGTSSPYTLIIYTPQAGDTTADSVMGQAGFTSNDGAFMPPAADTMFHPAGITVDRNSGRVFVADSENARVLSWPGSAALNDGQPADLVIGQPDFETVEYSLPDYGGAGVTAQSLDYPAGLAVDSSGNLYVADAAANRVLIYRPPFSNGMAAAMVIGQPDFSSSDIPATPAADNLNNPLGVAIDSSGNLYVADAEHHRVLQYDMPLSSGNAVADRVFGQLGSFTTGISNTGGISAGSLYWPFGVAVDGPGNLYIADQENHRVLAYKTPLSGGDTTADRVFGQGGSFTTNTINRGGLSADSLYWPAGLAVDAAGSLYVADEGNHRILRYDDPLTGDTTADRVFGQLGSFTTNQPNKNGLNAGSLAWPLGVAVDGLGNLYIADTDNSRALRFMAMPSVYLPVVLK